jgi:TolB-like protein/tetratricopeptide (TPR) repeat protein
VTDSSSPQSESFSRLRDGLSGRYEIDREIGQGGFATVYIARDLRHDRDVALKVLNADPTSQTGELRFIREIRLLARLQHPNILPLLDSGHIDALLYFVMPYVTGETLRARMTRERQLPIEAVARIACESADALAYAHAQGVIHRDIKPENILLSGGHAIVADFGVARAIDVGGLLQLTRTGMGGPGTPAYMSPEQLMGDQELDGRSDVYSLGCVVYEMLTGRAPFAGKDGFVKRFTESPPRPSEFRKDVPQWLDDLVVKTLLRDPRARFRTAEDLAAGLARSSTADGEISGAFVAPGARGRKSWRASGRTMALGILLAIGLLAGVAFAVMPRDKLATAMTLARRRPALLHHDRVIVAPFSNETGDQNLTPLGSMAADWIAQGLARTGTLEVVDARTVAITSEVVRHIPWPWRGRDKGKALARETGAGMLISGRYYRDADTLRFQANVIDVSDGKFLWSLSPVSGPASSPTRVLESLSRRVAALVAQTSDTTSSALSTLSDPPSLEAYSEFRKGLEGVFAHSPTAYDHLLRAAALDSTYVTPWVVLAIAAEDRGDKAVMDSALKAAAHLGYRMTPVERAIIDYTEAKTHGDVGTTFRAAQTIFQLTPGSSESPLMVATAALADRRPRTALEALGEVDPNRGLNLAAPFYAKNQTVALYQLGDYQGAAEACSRGRVRFPKDYLLSFYCVSSFAHLGEREKIAEVLERQEIGAQSAELAVHAAQLMEELGRAADARALAARALSRLVGDPKLDYPRALLMMALGQWAEAKPILTRLASADSGGSAPSRERRIPEQLRVLGALGIVNARLILPTEALRVDSLLADAGRSAEGGEIEVMRARIHAQLGDSEEAIVLANAARENGWELLSLVNSLAEDHWLAPLRRLPSFQPLIALRN